MKPQVGAVNVLERTSNYLKSGVLSKQPAWFTVIGQHPPSKSFLREPKDLKLKQSYKFSDAYDRKKPNAPIYKTRASQDSGRNIFKPQKLTFVEDSLRSLFYEQHPWELARPKILLENNGDNEAETDWSSIRQLSKPLDGESVVQRTLYLLNQEGSEYTLESAYDQARFEFYRIRIEQEIQQQVSEEENRMYGAVYSTSALNHGVQKEQSIIDEWKEKAVEISQIQQSRNANPQDQWANEEATEDAEVFESSEDAEK